MILESNTNTKNTTYLVAGVIRQKLLIPKELVLSKIKLKGIAKIPFTKDWVLGFNNFDGKLITVIDVNLFLGEVNTHIVQNKQILLIKHLDNYFGLCFNEYFPEISIASDDNYQSNVKLPTNIASIIDFQVVQDNKTLFIFSIDKFFQQVQKRIR